MGSCYSPCDDIRVVAAPEHESCCEALGPVEHYMGLDHFTWGTVGRHTPPSHHHAAKQEPYQEVSPCSSHGHIEAEPWVAA